MRVRVSTIGGRRWISTAGATKRGVRSVALRRRLRSGLPVRSLAVNTLLNPPLRPKYSA